MSNKVSEIREQMGKLHKKYNPFTDFNFENDLSIEEYVYSLGEWFKGLLNQFKSLEDKTNEAIETMTENLIPGPPNVLTIGTVENGVNAAASITGTSPDQVLNLVLPQGPQGPKGDPGSGGGVEFSTLDVTVTFNPFGRSYMGGITSTIPEGVVINDIVKIEAITRDASMPDAVNLLPLPVYDLVARNTNFEIQYATWYQRITGELPAEMREIYGQMFPLLIIFIHQRGVAPEGGTLTMEFRITYV